MKNLTCIESYITDQAELFGSFLIEPLEVGQGITLGNTLRRTLLSDLSGFAVTGARINNLKHEFGVVEGLREDILETLLNLKQIFFKASLFHNNNDPKFTCKLNVKGPIVITAGMFYVPQNRLKILNPNQYICTLLDNSQLVIEIDVEKGTGYRLIEEKSSLNFIENFYPVKASTLAVDSIFTPIRKVNYKVKLTHDTQGNIKEA
jgi:DNA-directed RNA polymerase subunit alpha